MKVLLLVFTLTATAFCQNQTCLSEKLQEQHLIQCEIHFTRNPGEVCGTQCENDIRIAYTDCEFVVDPFGGVCGAGGDTTTSNGDSDVTTQDVLQCIGDVFAEIDGDCLARFKRIETSNGTEPTDADVAAFCTSSCAPAINANFKQRCNVAIIESLCSSDAEGYCVLRAPAIAAELIHIAITSCDASNCSNPSSNCSQDVSQLTCCSESTLSIAGGVNLFLPSDCRVDECVSNIPGCSSPIAVMTPIPIATAIMVAIATLM